MSAERGGHNITGPWRLKTARSSILATRLPDGTVAIPSSTLSTNTKNEERYHFNQDNPEMRERAGQDNPSQPVSRVIEQAPVSEAAD